MDGKEENDEVVEVVFQRQVENEQKKIDEE